MSVGKASGTLHSNRILLYYSQWPLNWFKNNVFIISQILGVLGFGVKFSTCGDNLEIFLFSAQNERIT